MTVDENKIKHEHLNHLMNARKQKESADPGLWRHLATATAKSNRDRVASATMMAMKTQRKRRGRHQTNTFRSENPFNSYNNIIRHMLKIKLKPLTHICNSTDDVIKIIRERKLRKQVRMAKVDIKDFYQQGDQSEIAKKAFSDHNRKDAEAMINLQTHALFHQYVYSDLVPGRLFRVKTGSGMGQCASGELSDWYFYNRKMEHRSG